MKLTAPVNSFESCVAQIDAGADEIYLSYRVDFYKRMSFSARPQWKSSGYIMPSKEEFAKILDYAKRHQVSVFLAANTSYFSDYPIDNVDLEKEFLHYVDYGMECGVDGVIAADIGLIYMLGKSRANTKIVCSTLLDTDNKHQLEFLKELGVKRTVLSYQITLPELEILCADKVMEVEVFGYGGCSFSSNCMLGHSEQYGIPCENEYYTDKTPAVGKQICSALNCALCSTRKLLQLGTDAIKIQGRERDYARVTPITRMFRRAITVAEESNSNHEFEKRIIEEIPVWWKRTFCDQRQCKYKNHYDNRSIIFVEKLAVRGV